jgi:hypothetical protein
MNVDNISKLNSMLQKLPKGALYFSSWLNEQGVSYSLQQCYRDSHWFDTFAKGVMYRTGDTPTLYASLSCLNSQLHKKFRVGALSALELKGYMHYVPFGRKKTIIFYPRGEWFPQWLNKHEWGVDVQKFTEQADEKQEGITTVEIDSFDVLISAPERAFLECLELAPKYYNLTDLYYVMEMLTVLRPKLVQNLLENSASIKTKRLFLYMAEKAQHQWFDDLDVFKINLGNGKRVIVKNGVYNSKYKITIPRELATYE